AGYQGLATALFQAEVEYILFCPSLLLTEQSKHRLFEHFWNSNGARVGEDRSLGWTTWLHKEEEQRQKKNLVDDDVVREEFDEELKTRAIEQEDDTEALLKMLDGISHGDVTPDQEGDEQLLRVILFEDVEYLFSVSSQEARLSLVFQFIDFFGGSMGVAKGCSVDSHSNFENN
ncbi:hypothetical protein U1Q18_037746, partial [Sarracenia purpurea var. burkii]